MTKSSTPLSTRKFPLLIIFLGCSFPVIATIIDLWRLGSFPLSLARVLAVQTSQPLHWIIDSIPLFLLFSMQIFSRTTKRFPPSSKPTAYVEQQLAERTAKLTKTINELKAELVVSNRTEETLRAGEEFYRNLVENSHDGIITISSDGTITSVNRGVELMLGRPREDLIGQHYNTILSTSSSEQVEDRFKRFRNGEKLSSVFEAEWLHKNGSIIFVEARTRPIHDKTGIPIGFQGICRDIAKRQSMIGKLSSSQPLSQPVEREMRTGTSSSLSISAANVSNTLESSQNVYSSHESAHLKKPSHFALLESAPALEHPVGYSSLSKTNEGTILTLGSGSAVDEAKLATPTSQTPSTLVSSIPYSPTQPFTTLSEQQQVSSLPSQQKSDERSPSITFLSEQNTQLKCAPNPVIPSSLTSNEILNLDEALNQVDGDKELLSEMAGVFLDEYPRLLTAMHDALSHGNAQTLTYAVHTLKGSVGNFAASGAFEAALRLEKLGRQGNLSQAQGALTELEEQLAYLEPILANLKIEAAA